MLSDDSSFQFHEYLFTPWMTAEALQANTERSHEAEIITLYSEYEPKQGKAEAQKVLGSFGISAAYIEM